MKIIDKQNIILEIIDHAISGFGLGSTDNMRPQYQIIVEKYKKDLVESKELKKLFIDSSESFLITEIFIVSGRGPKEVLEIYDEFRKDLNLPDAFPDRSSVGL